MYCVHVFYRTFSQLFFIPLHPWWRNGRPLDFLMVCLDVWHCHLFLSHLACWSSDSLIYHRPYTSFMPLILYFRVSVLWPLKYHHILYVRQSCEVWLWLLSFMLLYVGVINTDNFSLLSLTIDYGPFGFLDRYNPGKSEWYSSVIWCFLQGTCIVSAWLCLTLH